MLVLVIITVFVVVTIPILDAWGRIVQAFWGLK